MQTIREAKIVIHLEQGPVNLKAPDLSKILADQQKHIDQTQRLTQEMLRLEAAQRAAAAAAANAGGSGGGTGPRGSSLAPGADEAEKALNRLYNAQMKYLAAQQNIGQGFFLMARAATLFSSESDDSFQKLIRNLAQVQAYFDVYRGFTDTVRGVVESIKALQKAELEAAIASGNLSRAQIDALKASQTFAAGLKMLAIAVSDTAVVMVALTSAIAVITSVYDILVTTEEEVKAANEGIRQAIEAKVQAMEKEFTREQELQNIRRQNMTDMQKAADLHRAVFAIEGIELRSWRARENAFSDPSAPAAAAEILESENLKAVSKAAELQEELNLRHEILQAEFKSRGAKIDQINQQQKQLRWPSVSCRSKSKSSRRSRLRSARSTR